MPLDDHHKNWNFLWILGWIWFTHMDNYNFSIFHWSSLLYKSSLHSQYGGCNFYWKTSGIETIQYFLCELHMKPHSAISGLIWDTWKNCEPGLQFLQVSHYKRNYINPCHSAVCICSVQDLCIMTLCIHCQKFST